MSHSHPADLDRIARLCSATAMKCILRALVYAIVVGRNGIAVEPSATALLPKKDKTEAAAKKIDADTPPSQESAGVTLGATIVTRMKAGAIVKANRGPVQKMFLMVAVPLECPEQQVVEVEQDITPTVEKFEYRTLNDGGVRQMLIYIPHLAQGEEARALVTYDVSTRVQVKPQDVSQVKAPAKVDATLKRYVLSSPMIEVNHSKIKKAVREVIAESEKQAEGESTAEDEAETKAEGEELTDGSTEEPKGTTPVDLADKPAEKSVEEVVAEKTPEAKPPIDPVPVAETPPPSDDWRRVETLYDYAFDHVKYIEGEDQSAVQTLKLGTGDCQAVSALFVAMCRTAKIPARVVWVDGHQYAEFYLLDALGGGHWYPVESAGSRAFGEMPIARVIYQKGDNFRIPERKGKSLRYATDWATGGRITGQQQPSVSYVHEQL